MTAGRKASVYIFKFPGGKDVKHDGGNKYHYCDKENDGERVDITLETDPVKFPGYNKLVHKPFTSGVKIQSIKYYEEASGDFNYSLDKCTSVSVYYWERDDGYEKLLLLEVETTDNGKKYYVMGKTTEWKDTNIQHDDLFTLLERENCTMNKAHHINISKKDGQPYDCHSCDHQIRASSFNFKGEYRKVTHEPNDGYVGRITDGEGNINEIDLPADVTTVEVYWYPNLSEGPILIEVKGVLEKGDTSIRLSEWYRLSTNGKTWRTTDPPRGRLEGSDPVLALLHQIDRELNPHFYLSSTGKYYKPNVSHVIISTGVVVGTLIVVCYLLFSGWKLNKMSMSYLINQSLSL
ncbi:hypothetical protein BEWA_048600 [Theileria equi strain WA]|uniref:Uncharacterized protein n=1 Tax=Theileria equi strain WA TaxID=1537102 RepID=L1LB64_THEEQ|nr:hypothetical protein BEWA_048600 [Theileria equi strain WA]EKX72393.1 hypothetical protein BEWA_048600 [Theileria equi strain WA]|eukprot:XP_004831845.1 hypothetical protein BEWA_048600 [Theileria equi strain WA]